MPVFRSGCEMRLFDFIMLRAGVSSEPVFAAGLGFALFGIAVDYGVAFHPSLGMTHVVSAEYAIAFSSKSAGTTGYVP